MVDPERLNLVRKAAHDVHRPNWTPKAAVSVATRRAQGITLLWQAELVLEHDKFFISEYPVSGANERFDLVDLIDRTVYELKTSGNNPHHEFYKDIFKVLIHNRNAPQDAFKHFVFLSTAEGVARLQSGLAQQVAQLSPALGFSIHVFDITNVA
jgi:hypothetical protein